MGKGIRYKNELKKDYSFAFAQNKEGDKEDEVGLGLFDRVIANVDNFNNSVTDFAEKEKEASKHKFFEKLVSFNISHIEDMCETERRLVERMVKRSQ